MSFLNALFPFTSTKVAVINKLLSACPDSTKEVILGRVVAKSLPDYHIKHRPYKVNPKRKEG